MIDEETTNIELGEAIKARRLKLKLTQQGLADLSGGDFTQTGIAMYEKGVRSPSPARLIRLSVLLRCSPCTLLPKAP